MKEVFEKSPNPEMCKNLFEDWVTHQRQVLSICNELIQHSIEVQRAPHEKQETAVIDTKVQWLGENLLKARMKARRQAYGSWMATTFYCYQLEKSRLRLVDPHLMEFMVGSQMKRQQIHLFDKIKLAKICRYTQISKFTQAAMEQQELEQGEPYDAEVAEGLHPDHLAELEQVRAEKRRIQEEKEKQAQERQKGTKMATVAEAIEYGSWIDLESD